LAQLPELLERMRSGGMQVAVHTEGPARQLPEQVELCCYRVVQEALTNAARYAPGAPVEVGLTYRDSSIAVGVTNVAGVIAPTVICAESGYGVIGMRERVTALGGQFRASGNESGYRVEASIPLAAGAPVA
jgi:signal transduction histidine kinase